MDDTKKISTSAYSSDATTNTSDSIPDENISMEELLKNHKSVKLSHLTAGDVVEGVFAGKTSDGYLFDIGHKREGVVPLSENIPQEILSTTTPIKLKVIKPFTPSSTISGEGGNPLLSWKAIIIEETLSNLENARQNCTPITATVTKKIKGGYLVEIDSSRLTAFLPAKHSTKNIENKIPCKIECIILEIKQTSDGSSLIVSEKEAQKITRARALEEFFKSKSVGDIVEGTITSLTKFGAFADIGGIDALIHITDISWASFEKIEDVIKVGQRIKARIKTMDPSTHKISLSIKDLQPNPWDTITTKFSVGDIIEVKVKNTTQFGVFCEITGGIEGLLHISEIDWKNPSPPINKLFKKGDTIKVKIISIDPSQKKIGLSIKQLQQSPWEKLSTEISVGKNIEGVITRFTPFGAIVKINDAIEGSLHVKNLDWFKKISHPSDILTIGQHLTLNVLEFKPQNQRLELSLKHTKPNPFQKYKKKTIVEFTVSKVIPAGAFAVLEEGIEAFIPASEILRRKTDEISNLVKPGDKLKGIITESDETRRRIEISVKKYEIAEEKKLLARYSSDKPHPKLEDILNES